MPAQATRGICNPFPAFKPKSSGVRKVTLSHACAIETVDKPHVIRSWYKEVYAYYSAIDNKWYKADGRRQCFVTGFYELSR